MVVPSVKRSQTLISVTSSESKLLMAAGICQVALQAMGRGTKDLSKRVFIMIFLLFQSLSYRSERAATKELVAGDIVKLSVRYMVEAGTDMHLSVVRMMLNFLGEPRGKEQASAPEVRDQLLKGLAEWLRQVCLIALCWNLRREELVQADCSPCPLLSVVVLHFLGCCE